MPFDYQALAAMTILFAFAWLPVSIGKARAFGGKWLASNRDPLAEKALEPWASRCERAYANLKDYFPAFVVAVLLLGATGKFDQSTAIVSGLFVLGRVGHYISYGLGSVGARATFFGMSFFANLYLLLKVFS